MPQSDSEFDLPLLGLIDAQYTRRPFYGSRKMVSFRQTRILLELKVNAEMELKEKELVSAKRLHQSKKTEPQHLKGTIFQTTQSAVVQAWGRACKHLGIENLHFHDTRHEATTCLSKKLPNVIELSAMSGHKNLKMLQRYYHVDPTEMAEKLD